MRLLQVWPTYSSWNLVLQIFSIFWDIDIWSREFTKKPISQKKIIENLEIVTESAMDESFKKLKYGAMFAYYLIFYLT